MAKSVKPTAETAVIVDEGNEQTCNGWVVTALIFALILSVPGVIQIGTWMDDHAKSVKRARAADIFEVVRNEMFDHECNVREHGNYIRDLFTRVYALEHPVNTNKVK